jgi:tight adherence protein B
MSALIEISALLSAGLSSKSALANRFDQLSLEQQELIKKGQEFGAPLGPALKILEQFDNAKADFEAEVESSQAVPRATRTLLLWLPAFALALGQLVGLDPLASLGSGFGITSFAIAGGLIFLGAHWSKKMLASTQGSFLKPANDLLAFQLAISSGVGLFEAKRLALESGVGEQAIQELVSLAMETGVGLSLLIEARIKGLILSGRTQALVSARALSVRLLIPLGLTVLPAFLILTTIPMLIGIAN